MNIATLIVNRNDPVRTDKLYESILAVSKSKPRDIYVLESGSDQDKLSRYCSVWMRDNVNWPMGFNILADYADRNKMRYAGILYDAYWMVCNDVQLIDDTDILQAMEDALIKVPDWGVAHPYQSYFWPGHPGFPLNKKQPSGVRKVSYVESVCPIIKRSLYQNCKDPNVPGKGMIDELMTRGWGIDYTFCYLAYKAGLSVYNIDSCGILHVPNTSHISHTLTKTEDQQTFLHTARVEMIAGLKKRFGNNWGATFCKIIPDLPDKVFRNWSAGDRAL